MYVRSEYAAEKGQSEARARERKDRERTTNRYNIVVIVVVVNDWKGTADTRRARGLVSCSERWEAQGAGRQRNSQANTRGETMVLSRNTRVRRMTAKLQSPAPGCARVCVVYKRARE